MTIDEIKISVIIPCYNSSDTIVRAVNSALSGTSKPYEVLVYDDCSNDNSLDLLEKNFRNNGLVRILSSSENKGVGYARNELIKIAKGDYVAFLDADDWWYPDKLNLQINKIRETDCDIVTCAYEIYSEFDQKIGLRRPIKGINFATMHLANWLPNSMTVVNKKLKMADEIPLIRRRQDYAYWLKIFKNNRNIQVEVIQSPLGGYTKKSNSLSSSKLDNLKYNFKMFREEMGYGIMLSIILTLINSIVRLIRS